MNRNSSIRRRIVRAAGAIATIFLLVGLAVPAPAQPIGTLVAAQATSPQDRDFLTTRSIVVQAQIVLRDLGLYRGQVNGQLTPSTRAAIFEYQSRNGLPRTSRLDREVLRHLGLVTTEGREVSAINVVQAEAVREGNGELRLRVATRNPGRLVLSENHFRYGDALHVYIRGYRADRGTNAMDELNVVFRPDEWRGVARIVVHGEGDRPVVVASDRFVERTGALTAQEAAALEEEISSILDAYSRQLRIRYDRRTGALSMNRANYRENEIELLFALNALSGSARLYTEMIRATTDPQALLGATDLYVRHANVVERAITRTQSNRASNVATQWQALRDDFARMGATGDTRFAGALP